MQDGFERSSLLMECIMPSYKSLIVTLQVSSASKDQLLMLLLLVPSKEKLSFLVTMVMSAGQVYEGPWPLEDEADTSGPPKLFAEVPSWHPRRKIDKVKGNHNSIHPYLPTRQEAQEGTTSHDCLKQHKQNPRGLRDRLFLDDFISAIKIEFLLFSPALQKESSPPWTVSRWRST